MLRFLGLVEHSSYLVYQVITLHLLVGRGFWQIDNHLSFLRELVDCSIEHSIVSIEGFASNVILALVTRIGLVLGEARTLDVREKLIV